MLPGLNRAGQRSSALFIKSFPGEKTGLDIFNSMVYSHFIEILLT